MKEAESSAEISAALYRTSYLAMGRPLGGTL